MKEVKVREVFISRYEVGIYYIELPKYLGDPLAKYWHKHDDTGGKDIIEFTVKDDWHNNGYDSYTVELPTGDVYGSEPKRDMVVYSITMERGRVYITMLDAELFEDKIYHVRQ